MRISPSQARRLGIAPEPARKRKDAPRGKPEAVALLGERRSLVAVQLPYPPTANAHWRHVGGKVLLSGPARKYRAAVATHCFLAKTGHVEGRLSASLDLHPPDRRGDIDNRVKECLDALRVAGVFRDDSQIDELVVRRREPRPAAPCVLVTIRALGEGC